MPDKKIPEAYMRWHIPLLIASLALPMPVLAAKHAYDMGKVQVVGKDAQSEAAFNDPAPIDLEMGARAMPLPEILPDRFEREPQTLEEKPFIAEKPLTKDELSVSAGAGTRGSKELRASGKGSYESYTGEIGLSRESKDGFLSSVNDSRNLVTGKLSTSGEGSYQLILTGLTGSDNFAQRGTRANPTPAAGISDDDLGFSIRGNSTLSDGAYFSAYGKVDSSKRDTTNGPFSFNEDSEMLSTIAGAEYRKSIRPTITGRAALDLKRDRYSISNGPDQKLTKRTSTLAAEIEMSKLAFLTLGAKDISLMDRSRFTPLLKLDYRWDKPWQFLLIYEEDLGNDSLHEIYMPRRYVPFGSVAASHKRDTSGQVNYRSENGNLLGAEIFSRREDNSREYVDMFEPAKGILSSVIRLAPDARRAGVRLHGTFKLDETFTLNLASTFQNPRDLTNDRRLSYEPRRLFEIGLGYADGPFHLDFARHASYDRSAYIPATQVDAGDYSRSDLVFRYNFSTTFKAFIKVRDLYDEAKHLRYNVPEEGRVSLAGIEASF